jgi:hypothetical protein
MEGPKFIEIPVQSYRSCKGCKHFSRELKVSGKDPIYASLCRHEKAPDQFFGMNIISQDKTPHWCPFLVERNK